MGGEEKMNPVLSHAFIGLACIVLGICIGYSLCERKKFDYQVVQNISVGVISLLAMSGLLVAINEYQDKAECQAKYNANMTQSLQDGRDAADADRKAQLIMVGVLLNPTATPDLKQKAFEQWASTLRETDQKRAASPLPAPPACTNE